MASKYAWIEDIDDIMGSLMGELNDIATRKRVENRAKAVLAKHGVNGYVCTGARVNTPEVVNNGSFILEISVGKNLFIFRI